MLGLGWTEMLVIGVVALVVIGPKDLPVVMGKVGKVIGQIQRMGREFQREINKTTGLDEVRNLRQSITSPLKQTADEIRKEFNAIGKDGSQSPTGALKPTDPNVESVVDAIHEKAGIAAPKRSNDALASEYGFKPSTPPAAATAPAEPVKAVRAPRQTSTAKVADAEAKPVKAAKPKATTAKAAAKPAEGKPAAAAKPAAAKAPKAAKPAAAKAAAEKPAAKTEAKPAAKPRAPRKKAADTAGKTE
ncbi:MAG: twin-arginine translocase subunit TatB [Phyllobacteriaceae bacterium]|nr:twin-arginine translocase subunit TatB [Phyllobacteriaceae bacterium]